MRKFLKRNFERADAVFELAWTPASNPLQQLGALAWFFYWIVIVSGIYLYIFFDTGTIEAYASVEYLTRTQWYAGGVMRSLHRYASDALVIVVLLHMLREFAMDRLHGPRWFSWVTGVALLWLLYASGISGYWIVWDKLAQYIATATSEWLDSLGIFGDPIARNFLHETTLSGRFFTLFIFIHIAVPLIMLFLMWVHIQRIARPGVNPPRNLAAGTLAALLVLSLAHPAVSQGPADLSVVPATINPDWFYMFFYPLLDRYPGLWLWAVLFALTALLMLLPWLTFRKSPDDIAEVNLESCNGCGRCVDDCPYNAVALEPRSDNLPYKYEAVVNGDLCVACGICAGACPTATPFRRQGRLVPGIELGTQRLSDLKEELDKQCASLHEGPRLVLFYCRHGADPATADAGNTARIKIPCAGMIPPPFLDYILSRDLADGVLLAGCREGGCYQRLGIDWTEQRVAGLRDPKLRARVPRERIRYCWAGMTGGSRLARELEVFRHELAGSAGRAARSAGEDSLREELSCSD